MNSLNLIVAVLLTISLFVGLSYAQTSGQGGISDIINSIINFLRSLIASIFGQQTTSTTSTSITTTISTTTLINPTTTAGTTTSIITSASTSVTTSASTTSMSTTIEYSPPCIKVGPLYINETLSCPPVELRLVNITIPSIFGVANAVVAISTNGRITYSNKSLYPSRNIIATPYVFGMSNGGILRVYLYQTFWNQYPLHRWANISINYTQPISGG